MSKLMLLLGLGILFLASPSMTQIDPDDNGIGIWFDSGATNNCDTHIGSGTLYLCITRCTDVGPGGGVAGFQCEVVVGIDDDPGVFFVTTWTLPSGGLNVDQPPFFSVGFGQTLPAAPSVVLCEIGFFAFGGAAWFDVIGYQGAPNPIYALGSNPNVLMELQPSCWDYWECTVNTDCTVDAEDSTWGGVKALFR